MSVIAPCITVETEEQYKEAIERLQPFATRVQIDISDGQFAPVLLLQPNKIYWPKQWVVDIHAMVTRPIDYVDKLISLQPHLIIFHAETEGDLLPIFQKIKQYNIKTGLALLQKTVPSTVESLIKAVDHVLIFSGDLGHYGGKASMMQLEKVRLVRAINPSVEIGWDGGVSSDNAFTLAQGGVDVLNSGGAINGADDPGAIYQTMIREINRQSVI